MGRINILDSRIYNRIAAGEVVERPASIVKELVENCIDAGADFITVSIENGGTTFISISDNGCGIETEDIEKAFLPHATSKIKETADLDNILTLGFRGEALCSIAAVSEITLTSRVKTAELAQFISIDHGKSIDRGEIGAPFGTTVTVRNLFEKIPARKKFLQKNKAEEAEITSIVARLILANSTVGFKYTADGKTVFHTSGKGVAEAIFAVYGMDTLNNLIKIGIDGGDIKISGYVSRPGYSKYSRAYQTLMINGRYIKNAEISFAVYNCFKDYLMARQYPMFVLFIELPPDMVDVNVHPGKTEAKFASITRVISLLKEAVNQALYDGNVESAKQNGGFDKNVMANVGVEATTSDLKKVTAGFDITTVKIPAVPVVVAQGGLYQKDAGDKRENQNAEGHGAGDACGDKQDLAADESSLKPFERPFKNNGGLFKVSEQSGLYKQVYNNYEEKTDFRQSGAVGLFEQSGQDEIPNDSFRQKESSKIDFEQDVLLKIDKTIEGSRFVGQDGATEQKYAVKVLGQDGPLSFLKAGEDFKRAGKLFDTYILIEKGNNVFIIDQHAAHERLVYDTMYKNAETQTLAVQTLLVPYFFSLTYSDAAVLDDNLEVLERCGFIIEKKGCEYYLCGIPLIASGFNESVFVSELLSMIRGNNVSGARMVRDKIIMASCKAAVKGNDDLSDSEIDALLKKMSGLSIALCPHGRPAVITLPRAEIEKWFKRRV